MIIGYSLIFTMDPSLYNNNNNTDGTLPIFIDHSEERSHHYGRRGSFKDPSLYAASPPNIQTNRTLAVRKEKEIPSSTTPNADCVELDELEEAESVSGVAPGGDTTKHSYCVPRRATVTCQNLEIISEKLKARKLRLCVYIKERVYKRRKTLKSSVIDIPSMTGQKPGEPFQVPLNNITFKLQYSHHFKKKIDVLRISLQSAKKRGDSFKTLSIISINLLHVLQRPFNDTVSFLIKKKKKKGREDGEPPSTNINSSQAPTSFNTNNAILHYLSSDDEDDERYQHHQQVPSPNAVDCIANLKVSIQTLPISLLEERKKKKKFQFLGKKGQQHPNTANMAPSDTYEDDFYDDDEETDEDSDVEYDEGAQGENQSPPMVIPSATAVISSQVIIEKGKEDKTLKAVIGLKDNIMKKWKHFTKKGVYGSDHEPPSPKGSFIGNADNASIASIKIEKVPIQEQISELLANKSLVKRVIMINGMYRRGQKLWSFLKRTGGLYTKDVLCTFSCEDTVLAMTKIFQSNTDKKYVSDQDSEIKIVIVGNDSYVNDVLRACLAQTTNEKQWDQFLFYLVPIPTKKNDENLYRYKNEISTYISARSSQYARFFSTEEWKKALTSYVDTEEFVEHVLFEYLENANQVIDITISQVLLVSDPSNQSTFPIPHTSARCQFEGFADLTASTLTVSPNFISSITHDVTFSQQCIVPLINNIHILNEYHEKKKNILMKLVQNLNKEDEKDNKEKPSIHKAQEKTSFVNSPPGSAFSPLTNTIGNNSQKRLSAELALEKTDSSDEGEESKQEKTTTLEMKIDYWDSNIDAKDKGSCKHSFSHVDIYKLPTSDLPSDDLQPKTGSFTLSTCKPKKKKKQPYDDIERKTNLSKIICKVEKKKSNSKVIVDGVEWTNVKVISITPTWVNNLKFKVASFTS